MKEQELETYYKNMRHNKGLTALTELYDFMGVFSESTEAKTPCPKNRVFVLGVSLSGRLQKFYDFRTIKIRNNTIYRDVWVDDEGCKYAPGWV